MSVVAADAAADDADGEVFAVVLAAAAAEDRKQLAVAGSVGN